MSDLDDDFDDDFNQEDDEAKLAEQAESESNIKATNLEKRRLIDNLLAEKKLERELQDSFDDDLDDLDDWDDWDDEDDWDNE